MPIEATKKELFSQDVEILINGNKIATAQECEIKAIRDAKVIKSFGEGKASAVGVGAKSYVISLSRIELLQSNIDFDTLDNFTVIVKKQGKTNTFSNCKWTELCEKIINTKAVVQSVTIFCTTLSVTGV